MKKFPWRVVATLSLVASMAVVTGVVSSASGAPRASNAAAQKSYQQLLNTYDQAKEAIQRVFRTAVKTAHVIYANALVVATTSAERSTARQQFETAIIEAASVRSNALTALGNPPTKPHTLTPLSGAPLL